MFKILFFNICLLISSFVFSQQPSISALNRFSLTNNDTLKVFYAVVPIQSIKIIKGQWYHWYNGERLFITQEGFSGKVLDGEYTVFYPAKSLKEHGFFDRGLKTGWWKTWDVDGKLVTKEKWKKGNPKHQKNKKVKRKPAARSSKFKKIKKR